MRFRLEASHLVEEPDVCLAQDTRTSFMYMASVARVGVDKAEEDAVRHRKLLRKPRRKHTRASSRQQHTEVAFFLAQLYLTPD